jgi:hypothetical protein
LEQTFETFTQEELTSILNDLDVDTNYISATDNESGVATIECELGPISFACILVGNEPFFEAMGLYSPRYVTDSPFTFLNKHNEERRLARAAVHTDDDDLIEIDEDGDICIYAQSDFYFVGGITKKHLSFNLSIWLEDLIDFHELVLDDDDETDNAEQVQVPELNNVPTPTLLAQIEACLSNGRSMTAKEIGRLLEKDRHELNPVLYKATDKFETTKDQPPRWSLKSP